VSQLDLPVPPPPLPDLPPAPAIGPRERFSATLALSLISFGVLILGIGFSRDDAAPVVPTLDVILTQTSSPQPPKQADFIAQANNQGGGDSERAQRPRESQLAVVPKPQPGMAPEHMVAQAPPPAPDPTQRLLGSTGRSDRRIPLPEEQPRTSETPLPTGRELMNRNMDMARLAAELERRQELYAKRPKRKFISASTQQYEYAAYMRAWVEKVERVGNLNYPDEARRRGLGGRLVMTVVLKRDGTVADIVLNTPSGQKLLDVAAQRIVRLAQPFPPLPRTQEEIDELHITRTWDFKNGGVDTE
jgi:protein TonB